MADYLRKYIRYVLAIAGLVILSLAIMDFNGRVSDQSRLTRQLQGVSAQATQFMATQFMLQTEIAHATSEGAVIEKAYEQGRLVRPGDVLVVPMPGAAAAVEVTPTPEPTPQSYQNWQFWYAIFFEPPP